MTGPPKKDRIPLKKGMWSAPDPDSFHLFAEHRLTAGQMTTTLAQHWPGIARRAVSIPWLVDLDAVIRHNDGIQRRPGYTLANAGSMLGQRHRRWPSIDPALDRGTVWSRIHGLLAGTPLLGISLSCCCPPHVPPLSPPYLSCERTSGVSVVVKKCYSKQNGLH